MAETFDIVAMSGSLRKSSYNTMLLNAVLARAPDSFRAEVLSFRGFPVYDGDEEAALGIPESVKEMQERIRRADGVVIATPEYNFSIPGPLKNAIDWLSRGKDQPFKGKRVGIMGASGGPVGTARSQYHLRQTLQGLEAHVMPRPEIFCGNAQDKFSDDGALHDEGTQKVIDVWLKHFEEWVRR
jgi:chromate reductase